jgi:hypothetical protein
VPVVTCDKGKEVPQGGTSTVSAMLKAGTAREIHIRVE